MSVLIDEADDVRPSFSDMESHTDRAVTNGQLQRPFSTRKFASQSYLNKTEHPNEPEVPASQILEAPLSLPPGLGTALRVDGFTEVVYEVPDNTTLLNITGPVGSGSFSCYAVLEPRPSWWGELPKLWAEYRQPTNQTLFVFPLDPTIKYQLAMGSVESQNSTSVESEKYSTCKLGAVTSYSYFWYEAGRPSLTVGSPT